MGNALKLFRAGANGRIALGDLVKDGDHFTAHVNDDGSITLSQVEIVTTSYKTSAPAYPAPVDGDPQG